MVRFSVGPVNTHRPQELCDGENCDTEQRPNTEAWEILETTTKEVQNDVATKPKGGVNS